jgi:hypothetical protein
MLNFQTSTGAVCEAAIVMVDLKFEIGVEGQVTLRL